MRGSISQNIVAQKGLFTIHPIDGDRASPVVAKSLEEYLRSPNWSPIRKLIVPVKECVTLYELCRQFSYNAARLYPSAKGASMYVAETQYHILGHAAIAYPSAEAQFAVSIPVICWFRRAGMLSAWLVCSLGCVSRPYLIPMMGQQFIDAFGRIVPAWRFVPSTASRRRV